MLDSSSLEICHFLIHNVSVWFVGPRDTVFWVASSPTVMKTKFESTWWFRDCPTIGDACDRQLFFDQTFGFITAGPGFSE